MHIESKLIHSNLILTTTLNNFKTFSNLIDKFASLIIYDIDQKNLNEIKNIADSIDVPLLLATENPEIINNITIGFDGIISEDIYAKTKYPNMIVGVSGIKTRHDAMLAGENKADFIFFGKPGYDKHPDPLNRNVDLCQWWCEFTQIAAILQLGSKKEQIKNALSTRADFLSIESMLLNSNNKEATIAYINEQIGEI